MDLDLKIELRLAIKSRGLPARIELDDNGYWLCVEHRGKKTRMVLSDAYEPSILEVMDDVSAVTSGMRTNNGD